jgi:hypothetical protein
MQTRTATEYTLGRLELVKPCRAVYSKTVLVNGLRCPSYICSYYTKYKTLFGRASTTFSKQTQLWTKCLSLLEGGSLLMSMLSGISTDVLHVGHRAWAPVSSMTIIRLRTFTPPLLVVSTTIRLHFGQFSKVSPPFSYYTIYSPSSEVLYSHLYRYF